MRRAVLCVLVGLALASLACSSSSNPSTPSNGSVNVSIVPNSQTLTTNAYNPNPVTISHGGTITWMNNDAITHTATSDTGVWDSGNLGPGASFSKTFQNAGTFTYKCTIHPGMVGTVNVQ